MIQELNQDFKGQIHDFPEMNKGFTQDLQKDFIRRLFSFAQLHSRKPIYLLTKNNFF
jgi:hypothetical protein